MSWGKTMELWQCSRIILANEGKESGARISLGAAGVCIKMKH